MRPARDDCRQLADPSITSLGAGFRNTLVRSRACPDRCVTARFASTNVAARALGSKHERSVQQADHWRPLAANLNTG